MLKWGVPIRKKKFDFPISELLDVHIDAFIEACNTNSPFQDCYQSELYNEINNSLHVDLTDSQAEELRNYYYLRDGMYAELDDETAE